MGFTEVKATGEILTSVSDSCEDKQPAAPVRAETQQSKVSAEKMRQVSGSIMEPVEVIQGSETQTVIFPQRPAGQMIDVNDRTEFNTVQSNGLGLKTY